MLDVGISGEYLVHMHTRQANYVRKVAIILGEFVNIKLTFLNTTGEYGKVGGQSLFFGLIVLFGSFWPNLAYLQGLQAFVSLVI